MPKFDYVLANPPFNISDWGGERLTEDMRWAFGNPPKSNANYGWLQHIVHHLAPRGTAGIVLANGSMSSQSSGEGEIRKALVDGIFEKNSKGEMEKKPGVIDCMVALPGQLFYSTQIPVCLWILSRDKSANGHRDRQKEILFIDARNKGHMVDRVRKEFSEQDIEDIAGTYRRWRAKPETLEAKDWDAYEDQAGFCKSASLEEVQKYDYVLTPGRYVGAAEVEDDGVPFEDKFAALREKLAEQMAEGQRLDAEIERNLGIVNSKESQTNG